MSLKGLFASVEATRAYHGLVETIRSGARSPNLTVLPAAGPLLLAALRHDLDVPILVIASRPDEARRLHGELITYLGQHDALHYLPEPEAIPFERLVSDGLTNNQRLAALAAMDPRQDTPFMVVTSAVGALRKTIPPEAFQEASQTFRVGQRARLGQMLTHWVELGYRRDDGVEVPGSFSLRGGIVDVYSPQAALPARLEFVGDEIDSIRLFNPSTQRSVGPVDSVTVMPCREALPSLANRDEVSRLIAELNFTDCTASVKDRIDEELAALFAGQGVEEHAFYNGLLNHGCLLDYLPARALVVLSGADEVASCGNELTHRMWELRHTRESRGELPTNFPAPQLDWPDFHRRLESTQHLSLQLEGNDPSLSFHPPPLYFGRLEHFAEQASSQTVNGARMVVVSRHARRVAEILEDAGVGASIYDRLETLPEAGTVSLVSDFLQGGWTLESQGVRTIVLSDAELFGLSKERPSRRRSIVRGNAPASQLAPGEYVVHVDHGIARFAGTQQREVNGENQEYLVLEYAEGDKLLVPTGQLDRVSPYLAPSDQQPSLTRLNTQEWARAKARARASTKEMAQELLQLYASRQVAQGHSFPGDSAWQRELEDSFPYEETEDQRRTIDEVKEGMENPQPMDRLVCGDVGYGKTEVALRAAFKAVEDGMQVAILVPTTVLAQQHYATFTERLAPFPARVEVLSRFRSPKEQDDIIERLKLGTVDIVIGTHRLLQKDVSLKNLGLVIVDEEQRFGVVHKEQLKRLRREVDILTLSATPIPRTLYMSLSGIRDMSTMETPPEERLPVKTTVCEYSDDVIQEAIQRELDRGGQAFFLHNRVNSIQRIADHIKQLVPEATIGIGHGRMHENELEEVMSRFAQGEMDVLVCTSIIESGLDIPNANTLIIDRADRFGLSQLYQLRGRVGRATQRAYAYLLTPPRRRITEAAGKRLAAVLEAAELGSGFRIAMRDLEIRGAGNILGAEQSGNIHAVGFELYSQLLNQAVGEAQQEVGVPNVEIPESPPMAQARVNLPLTAHIPEEYIAHLPARLEIYQRLARADSPEQVDEIGDEMRDRFGPMPEPVADLLYVSRVRVLADRADLISIAWADTNIVLRLSHPVGGAGPALEKALGPLVRVGNNQLQLSHRRGNRPWQDQLVLTLQRLLRFMTRLQAEGRQEEQGIAAAAGND